MDCVCVRLLSYRSHGKAKFLHNYTSDGSVFETVPSEIHRCKFVVLTEGRGEEINARNR
jgi:hypothetical protein